MISYRMIVSLLIRRFDFSKPFPISRMEFGSRLCDKPKKRKITKRTLVKPCAIPAFSCVLNRAARRASPG